MDIDEAMGEIEPRYGKQFPDFIRWAEVGAKCGNPWFAADKLERAWRSLDRLPRSALKQARGVLELANKVRDGDTVPSWWRSQTPSIDVEHELFMLGWEREHAFGTCT